MCNYQRIFLLFFFLLVACTFNKPAPPLTGLEKSNYLNLTSLAEISSFLNALSLRNDFAKQVIIGTSALGNPLNALLISKERKFLKEGHSSPNKMTVVLIGAQHGMEPSGTEALLVLARDLAGGRLNFYLDDMDFVIIPVSNPDGKNANLRANGNRINISTNFSLLSEPETQALYDIVCAYKPAVILDIHESAVFKKKTLARQGYLIDFEAQWEAANNPNVDSRIRSFSFGILLPEIITLVNHRGLRAQRYIGEITDIHRTITHGGLSLRNLRNLGGMLGAFSFLLENRLDPSAGRYPTPRNIRERFSKQYLSISSFLSVCQKHKKKILTISRKARNQWKDKNKKLLFLFFGYGPEPNQPNITIPLKKIETNELVSHSFRYYSKVIRGVPFIPPAGYIVTSHYSIMKEFLDRHHIAYQEAALSFLVPVIRQKVVGRKTVIRGKGQDTSEYTIRERNGEYLLHKGDLIIPLNQPAQKRISLFLEPKSLSCIFNSSEYSRLVEDTTDFFIYRVTNEGSCGFE